MSSLLVAVERGAETLTRLDVDGRPTGGFRAFDRRLRTLETRIDRELDRLTAELLRRDLEEKRRRTSAA